MGERDTSNEMDAVRPLQQHRFAIWLALIAGLAAVVAVAVWFIGSPPTRGREFVYSYPSNSELTEATALIYARRSLEQYDPRLSDVEPYPDSRAREGDRYLLRNTLSSNDGQILFENADRSRVLYVDITLSTDSIRCTVTPAR